LVQACLVFLGFGLLWASEGTLGIFGLHLSAVEYGFVALFFGLVLALTHKPEELRVHNAIDNPDSASAMKAEDPNPSIPTLQKAAEQGDAKAQYTLGRMYQDGRGIAKDDAKAQYGSRRPRRAYIMPGCSLALA
jgi:hypothetical protein